MTIRALITTSLRQINAIATGETPAAAEIIDAMGTLNRLLHSWAISGLLVFKNTRETFALTASQQSYTMGTGGTFNTPRPTKITYAAIIDAGVEYPIEIVTDAQWDQIHLKNTTSSYPSKLLVEGGYPLATLYFWPKPSGTPSVVLSSQKPFTTFAQASDELDMPPGYERALISNLAIELAPEYGKDPSALVLNAAIESKAEIMRSNLQPIYIVSDAASLTSGRPFNIITGE